MFKSPRDRDTNAAKPSHYDVLQLPRPGVGAPVSKEEVKAAYRRALLLHHPDKAASSAVGRTISTHPPLYSIDDIVTAYDVLIDPQRRAAYDRALEQEGTLGQHGASSHAVAHGGVEEYDLEELELDQATNIWTKSCRCGDPSGYVVAEADFESELERGEIYVGCHGCSLFIKVLFALQES